ncbi:hypothetical protein ACFSJW_07535 [Flavobacterium artemisiae]|uniref:Phage abortive infection protein n=1 Tax=Flavobacterium artemisiae TaxID=2126556 RepID=A0ABW4HBQ2_9FLAO
MKKNNKMIDKITSVFDNYQNKIKNPFIGTIIGVWIIHNWKILFALFNFDKGYTLEKKIKFIDDHFAKQIFWHEVLTLVGVSFLLLLISFLLMAVSRALTDFYFKIVETFIINKIDKNAVLSKELKDKLEVRIVELEKIINNQRSEITSTESNNQLIVMKRDAVRQEFDLYIEKTKKEQESLNVQIANLEKFREINKDMYSRFQTIIKNFDESEKKLIKLFMNKKSIMNSPHLKEKNLVLILESHGFLTKGTAEKNSISFSDLTDVGLVFVQYCELMMP